MMKRISIAVAVATLGVWVGACDVESFELRDVELIQTEEGVLLVDGEGDEMLLDAEEVDVDVALGDSEDSFPLTSEPTSIASICCEQCNCNPSGCTCTGCEPCSTQAK